jgi:hypothetical protein
VCRSPHKRGFLKRKNTFLYQVGYQDPTNNPCGFEEGVMGSILQKNEDGWLRIDRERERGIFSSHHTGLVSADAFI